MNTSDTLYVFDIDGTLTDSIPTYLKVITKVLSTIGLKDIDTDYNNYLHHTDRYALEYNYERNFGKKAPDSLRFELDTLLETELKKHEPVIEIPGARDLLLDFQKNEIPFSYGTGAFPKATIVKMKDANIPFIQEVLATSITSVSRVGFVQEAIEKSKKFYNQDFKKIVAVGDGLWDLKVAQELNIDFLGVGLKNKEVMQRHGCANWVEDFKNYKI
ncbi:MAG: phosphoglycolate phosphatase-like HAD superfamily hydrolase [Dokdonia sp.]|jgi:phosphoglycolate phosphatase-like HAD superfamily hydrolase